VSSDTRSGALAALPRATKDKGKPTNAEILGCLRGGGVRTRTPRGGASSGSETYDGRLARRDKDGVGSGVPDFDSAMWKFESCLLSHQNAN
jgi:hypothetical protein